MKLVVVPLKKELNSLISVLDGVEKNDHGYQYKENQFVVGGLGKVNFALNTYKYGILYEPTEIFAAGTCGALKSLNEFEVVVVEKVVEYDFESSFLDCPEFISDTKNFPDLKRVICASGDKDIVINEAKARLVEGITADIVTWETAGFFNAAHMLRKPFTEIRVVTDKADDSTQDSFIKNLSLGMRKIGVLFK